MKVYAAISKVAAAMASEGVAKTRTNEHQRYKFRGIDEVMNALARPLVDAGLVVLPRIVRRECEERESKDGKRLNLVTVEAEYDFVAVEDGSRHTVRTFGEASDSSDKATNKAMSAAYKYALFETFCIPTEGDNDADATTHEIAPRAKSAREARTDGDWQRIEADVRAQEDPAAVTEILKRNTAIIKAWPASWQQLMRDEGKRCIAALREKQPEAA